MVGPGVDPTAIRMSIQGTTGLKVDAEGNLVLQTSAGDVMLLAPVIYQMIGGARQAVAGGYLLTDDHQVGVKVSSCDASRPLIIDPIIVYSTYLGGTGVDLGFAMAVDSSGDVYLAGWTDSIDLPLQSAFDTVPGSFDAFVTKLDPAASGSAQILYSTYLGGAGKDTGLAIAVDSSGNVFLTGETQSSDFPLQNAFDSLLGGTQDAFVTQLDPAASGSAQLAYSSYLGGAGDETARGIAVDSSGNVYLTGKTESTDFPMVDANDTTLGGNRDAFVAKLVPGVSG